MFRFHVHRSGREVLLAACDEEIVGREFRDGRLRIKVVEAFYGSDRIGPEELALRLRTCTIANLVGERVVSPAVEHGFVAEERVLRIAGVPHAQMAVL